MRPARHRSGTRPPWLVPLLAAVLALAVALAPVWSGQPEGAARAQGLTPVLAGGEPPRSPAPIVLDGRTLFRIWPSSTLSAEQRSDTINQQLAVAAAGEGDLELELRRSNNLPVLVLNGRTLLTVTERDVPEGMETMEQAEAWRQQLEQGLRRARLERRPDHLRRQLPRVLAALAVAATLHWGVQAFWRRRFPQAWALQPEEPIERQRRGARFLQRATLLLLQVGVWLAAMVWISDQFPISRQLRSAVMGETSRWLGVPLLPLGERSYSLLDVVILVALLLLLVRAVGLVLRLLRTRVLRYTGMSLGGQEAVAFLTRYGLLFVGALVLLQLWGLDLSSLTLFASVLGVGVGLGFQTISKNLLSGMVIIFERPIQVGDFVEIGDLQGTVQKLGLRSTVVETLDRIAIIVPNSEFLDSRVVNWSHGSPVSRLRLPVGVAYGSDTNAVREVLLDACVGQPSVLSEPPPRVFFSGFGDSALDFTLLVWIREPMRQYQITSDLNFRIEALLRERGITVPFPQRDLHLTGEALELRLSPELESRLMTDQQQRHEDSQPPH
ncbi:mechanosensitive ion channel [Cyanobium sp. ATX 6A2]|uniref:mechanosensitive ion channel family protein n=1 Tax=Cyanobium sp. ATX 6A2 TaxID=2823700 RepID=UPI0020CDDAD3|nr:mechanosensitive ion channel domain-containing protein [Cyanobium sp. ATX 6A2]MCP9887618.1 mechanosensitive ion channel [Cyanobium sp. ATX 6A2]